MTAIYIPPATEGRPWWTARAERAIEDAARKQGIPVLTGEELFKLDEPASEEFLEVLDLIIERYTTEL